MPSLNTCWLLNQGQFTGEFGELIFRAMAASGRSVSCLEITSFVHELRPGTMETSFGGADV